jgi:hypothetical protein
VTAVSLADEASELASNLVIVALCQNALGDCQPPLEILVAGIGYQCPAQHFNLATRSGAFADTRAAEDHYGVTNSMLGDEQFWLEILDQKAHATKVVAREEIDVLLCKSIARAAQKSPERDVALRDLPQSPWGLARATARAARAEDARVC